MRYEIGRYGNDYSIFDNETLKIIAVCDYQSDAQTIVNALNMAEAVKVVVKGNE